MRIFKVRKTVIRISIRPDFQIIRFHSPIQKLFYRLSCSKKMKHRMPNLITLQLISLKFDRQTLTTGPSFSIFLTEISRCAFATTTATTTRTPRSRSSASRDYNLVQAAFVGKPGSDLAADLGVTAQDDVLFAVFSESDSSEGDITSKPSKNSALCVYSLKSIR